MKRSWCLKERKCQERHQTELQEDKVVELGMKQVQEQECGGSVLPQDCSNSRREKASPEAGLSSGVLRTLENKAVIHQGRGKLVKIGRHPQMGEAALTVHCTVQGQGSGFAMELQASKTWESLEREELSSVLAGSCIPIPGVMLQGLSLQMPLQLSYFISELI